MVTILGISAYYHDSAAAIVVDGQIVAAAQEERFTRKKNDASFPINSIKFVLKEAGISGSQLDYVAFYEKPFIKFERLLETYQVFAPVGLKSFLKAIPVWLKGKLYIKKEMQRTLKDMGITSQILFPEHHLSHAASAFFPSPFNEAAILTVDGVGEWATTTICKGTGNKIASLCELHFPHSLGLLYSAFTYYCGFRVNSGEYKLMGLAPYGTNSERSLEYIQKIKEHLVDIREDGSFLLNTKYFEYATGLRMTNNRKWTELFGIQPREQESEILPEYIDLAYAAQSVTEEILLKLSETAQKITGCENLVLAGGVALNCVANGKIKDSGLFRDVWIQPAAGDAGGAVGSALAVWHIYLKNKRVATSNDGMLGAYLGPEYPEKDIQSLIRNKGIDAKRYSDEKIIEKTAGLISDGAIVGWFQGRMEFGPRALGNRSILADPSSDLIQKKLNLDIKYRESFRPFAPSVLEEDVAEYFDLHSPSPYMLLVAKVKDKYLTTKPENYESLPLMEKLYCKRSSLQAITHVNLSARIQTVSKSSNPKYYRLLTKIRELTGVGMLVNTSFNVRNEPIVCTPENAYNCFMNTGMDYLVMGNFLFSKSKT